MELSSWFAQQVLGNPVLQQWTVPKGVTNFLELLPGNDKLKCPSSSRVKEFDNRFCWLGRNEEADIEIGIEHSSHRRHRRSPKLTSNRAIAVSADFTATKAVLQANRSTRSPLRVEIRVDLLGEFFDELFPLLVRQGRKTRLNLLSQLREPSERRYRSLSFQDGPKRVSLARFLDLNSLFLGQARVALHI